MPTAIQRCSPLVVQSEEMHIKLYYSSVLRCLLQKTNITKEALVKHSCSHLGSHDQKVVTVNVNLQCLVEGTLIPDMNIVPCADQKFPASSFCRQVSKQTDRQREG